MAFPLVMDLDGLCRHSELLGSLPSTDQLISIDLPVGQGPKAKNLDKDVRTIQESLNKIEPTQGGPAKQLVVDGLCGPKTNKAISDFQFRHFKFKGADGLIEPGKQSIQRIILAGSPGGLIDLGHSTANDRLDRHFGLKSLPAPARSRAIRNIGEVYNKYSSAILMPPVFGDWERGFRGRSYGRSQDCVYFW